MNETSESHVRGWHLAPELPVHVFEVLRKPGRAINPVSVVATVNADGTPHTAPFGSLRALSPSRLRMICFQYHHTYTNLLRDGRTSISVLAPPDIAVSIRGFARMVKAKMEMDINYAIFEIKVDQVKNDMVKTMMIETSITASAHYEYKEWFDQVLAELEEDEL